MPKGDGTLKALNSSIKIYYEHKDKQWLFNDKFKKLISKEMGFEFLKNGEPARDGPFLIKKSEIARYFGLIEYIFGKKGKIIAVEPTEFAFNKLNRNISLNKDLSNISVIKKIVSDSVYEGSDEFNSDWDLSKSQSPHKLDFVSTTLDLLVGDASLQKLDLLKIDVDGYDYMVLRGGRNVIENFKPTIFIELCEYALNKQDSSVSDIFTYLEGFGYECFHEADGRKINAKEVMSEIGLTTSINGVFKIK